MFPSLFPRPLRALGVLILIAAIGGGFWAWHRAVSSDAVSEDAALRSFRGARAASAPARAGVPQAGVYTYRQSGSERGGVGPAHLSRSLPDRARYVVTPTPDGYREELDLSSEHIEGARLRVDRTAVRELSRRTDVTFLGVGRDDRRTLIPPSMRLSRPLRVGTRWSSRYVLGDLPATTRGRVLRADAVEVEGRRLPVLVIRSVTETTGTHAGTRTDTLWWSTTHSLALRRVIDTRVRGPVSLHTRSDLALESVTPKV